MRLLRYICAFVLLVSFVFVVNADAEHKPLNYIDKCKSFGDLSVEVMNKRQSKTDVFTLLKQYPNNNYIVLEAYKYPSIDLLSQLSIVIEANRTRAYADEMRKYKDMETRLQEIKDEFRNKIISNCINGNI